MDGPLRILLLEDMKNDQELIKRQVLKFAARSIFLIAENKSSFFEKISWFKPDMILADYHLPDFNGIEALLYIKEKMPIIPFVFITGELKSEERAAQAIISGADGYILKQNLEVIPEVLRNVFKKNEEMIKQRKALEDKIHKHKFNLQKAHQLLLKTPQFEGRRRLIEIIESLNSDSIEILMNTLDD